MRSLRRVQAAAAAVLTVGLAGCQYAPEYAATLTAAGHVQIEWCNDDDLLVVVGDSELQVSYTPPQAGKSNSNISAFDLTAVAADQWAPAPPALQPDDTAIEIWPPSHSTPTNEPLLTFRPSELDEGRYMHQGRLISPGSWRAACNPDDEPLIPPATLIVLAILGFACIASVIGLITWAIKAAWRSQAPR